MRTITMALLCGLLALPMTASAASHGKKSAHHTRSARHAKAKSKHARAQHASRAHKSKTRHT